MKDYFLYKGASDWSYAASIASTWIWAPALFVSSSVAHNMGLAGLLWFLIPNTLTLIVFGHIASHFRREGREMALADVACKNGSAQEVLHNIVACVLLVCSTTVQLIGIHTMLSAWFDIPKYASAAALGFVCFAIVWRGGLKCCIDTDMMKYRIVFLAGAVFAVLVSVGGFTPDFEGYLQKGSWEVAATFGITTAIGLMSAPYIDQTFWQRVFSIHPQRVVPVFYKSALLFAIIPLCFGYVGLCAPHGAGWDITWVAVSLPTKLVLAAAVLAALISTLDSNLCAIASMVYRNTGEVFTARLNMVALFLLAALTFCTTDITIVHLFLFYGTLRTCLAVPTILMIFDRFSPRRLLGASVFTVLFAPVGYALAAPIGYGWIFTVLALVCPLWGFSSRAVYR